MEPFSAWILPLLLSGAALWGARRRVDVYDALVTGGKSGLQVAVSILPALAALLTAVYMLRASGALDALTALLAPALTALGVPPETAPLLVIRPLSGSGALAAGGWMSNSEGKATEGARVHNYEGVDFDPWDNFSSQVYKFDGHDTPVSVTIHADGTFTYNAVANSDDD